MTKVDSTYVYGWFVDLVIYVQLNNLGHTETAPWFIISSEGQEKTPILQGSDCLYHYITEPSIMSMDIRELIKV